MLIGELSCRTGVPARLLRYYEEQDLLHPERDSNGYRRYGAADVWTGSSRSAACSTPASPPRSSAGSCRTSGAGSTCPRSA